jgi:hypothetical protein
MKMNQVEVIVMQTRIDAIWGKLNCAQTKMLIVKYANPGLQDCSRTMRFRSTSSLSQSR